MLVVRVRDRTGMGSVPPPRGVLIEAGHPNILHRILTKVKIDEKVLRFFKISRKKLHIKNVRMNAFLLINRSADLDLNKNIIFQLFIGYSVGSAHMKLLINSSQCGFAAA